MSKWKIEAIIVAVLICVGVGVWWYAATNDVRKANAEYENLVRFAEKQAVEIAIIEQASTLQGYRQRIAQNQQQLQQRAQQAIAQPVVPDSFVPPADPDSIE
jgi:cbb3-type cytochrome oxidase subunit 3